MFFEKVTTALGEWFLHLGLEVYRFLLLQEDTLISEQTVPVTYYDVELSVFSILTV
jgi:hypothetical protein